MTEKIFYVYEWYNKMTGEVFYVGKGCHDRYLHTKRRNQLFQEYIQNNEVASRKIYENLYEDEAFALEKETIDKYKQLGSCKCNLMDGGTGGVNFIWTPEMREYWSENNPMKRADQRKRMSENNPMHDPEVAKRVGDSHKRAIIVQGTHYDGLVDAAKVFNRSPEAIRGWLKAGYDPISYTACYYEDEGPKEFTLPQRVLNKLYPNEKPVKENHYSNAVLVDGKLFISQAKAAEAIGVTPTGISYALKHSGKCKGHIVKYANQQPS